jgi:hypothetical protein
LPVLGACPIEKNIYIMTLSNRLGLIVRSRFGYVLILTLLIVTLTAALSATLPARAANNGLGTLPLMGWSSWSLESTNLTGYGIPYLTAENLISQSDYLHKKLQPAGYNYFNIDSGWWMDSSWKGGKIQGDQYDAYGRPMPDPVRFPNGIAAVANHIKANGQHLGMYYIVGLPRVVFYANPPILGTTCHAQDIITHPLKLTNGWQDHWAIDFNNPCAQAYINSIADQFAAWGVDFLKIDGVLANNQADVKAWSVALQQTGRRIWLTLSWSLDRKQADLWKQYANAARIDDDVECYCGSLVTWSHGVVSRFTDAPKWASVPDSGYKNELDSLDIGSASIDGVSTDERQSYMTLWAISGANLLVGDDLSLLDSYGLSLLTNSEVIAQDQTGKAAIPVSQASSQQVWWVKNADGSDTVTLFNLDDSQSAVVTANWTDFGMAGTLAVHDMWSHADLGRFADSWSATIPPHGSRLIKVTP